MLASRGTLPVPTGRLLVDGLATEIAGPELSFNAEETGELLRNVAGGKTATTVDALLDRTGGWAVAIAFAARGPDGGLAGDDVLGGDDRRLFAYFAEEVLASESAETRAALGVAAALPWLTPDLAAHLGLGDAGARLTAIGLTSIMMTPVAEVPGAVAVTPLVRQLLGAEPAPPLAASLATPAAAWYESRGAHSAALACLTGREAGAAVARFLRANGQAMIASGQGADVLDALHLLDSASTEIDIELGILWAESLQAVGRPDEAVERLAATVPRHGPIPTAVAWRLGALHYLRGDTHAASTVLDRADLGAGWLRRTTQRVWRGERQSSGRGASAMQPAARHSSLSSSRHRRLTTGRWPRRTRC